MKPVPSIYIPPFFSFGKKFSPPLGEAYSDASKADTREAFFWAGLAFLALVPFIIFGVALLSPMERNSAPAATHAKP